MVCRYRRIDYRFVVRCIHGVTSEYGFKLAIGVNTVLNALAADKVKDGKVVLPSEADYGVAQLVIHLFRLYGLSDCGIAVSMAADV